MALFATVYTVNTTDNRVWITIYDLGKTTHLDYGWVDARSSRAWASGSYAYGSFYHVRGEVKSNAAGSDPNIYDTSIQINPQAADKAVNVRYPPFEDDPSQYIFNQQVDTSDSVVLIQQGTGNYYWSKLA
ncbi:MAG TPA: hypothetical protein VKB79_14165 [Bryobacteraceae bacterium]|nr:hypothetical protein [Bryobacteraceae bacterium]